MKLISNASYQTVANEIRSVEDVRQCLRKQQRGKAMFILKKKRMLESVLQKRETALLNVNTVFNSIQDAHSDLQVVEALKKGSETLKSLTKTMEEQEVEKTLDKVAETLLDVKEFQRVMDTGMESTLYFTYLIQLLKR